MDKLVKLIIVAVILGVGVQAALAGGAWMDDKAFETAVLGMLGDNMTSQQMENDIRAKAAASKIPMKPTDPVKVAIECVDGAGMAPRAVAGRLGPVIGVNKSCTVTGTAHYTRRVGLMSKSVNVSQSKRFAAGAQINYPSSGGGGGVQMPNIPAEVPMDPRLNNPTE